MESKTGFIRTRIEPSLKGEVESMLHAWGMTTTQAIDMFYRQIKRTQKFPLELSFNEETELAINNAKQGKKIRSFKSPETMFTALGMLPRKNIRTVNKTKKISKTKRRQIKTRLNAKANRSK